MSYWDKKQQKNCIVHTYSQGKNFDKVKGSVKAMQVEQDGKYLHSCYNNPLVGINGHQITFSQINIVSQYCKVEVAAAFSNK